MSPDDLEARLEANRQEVLAVLGPTPNLERLARLLLDVPPLPRELVALLSTPDNGHDSPKPHSAHNAHSAL